MVDIHAISHKVWFALYETKGRVKSQCTSHLMQIKSFCMQITPSRPMAVMQYMHMTPYAKCNRCKSHPVNRTLCKYPQMQITFYVIHTLCKSHTILSAWLLTFTPPFLTKRFRSLQIRFVQWQFVIRRWCMFNRTTTCFHDRSWCFPPMMIM